MCLFCMPLSLAYGQGETIDECFSIQQEDYLQYRIWAAARNYRFGMTTTIDPIKAFAWQLVYIDRLPKSYPYKSALLKAFKEQLSEEQRLEAKKYSAVFREAYGLQFQFSEDSLYQAYQFREADCSKLPNNDTQNFHQPGAAKMPSIGEWISEISKSSQISEEELQARYFDLSTTEAFPIAYGTITLGKHVPAMLPHASIAVGKDGVIFAKPDDSYSVRVDLVGYNSISIPLNKKPLQYLGNIQLQPSSKRKKTGIIGKIIGYTNADQMNLLLVKKDGIPLRSGSAIFQNVARLNIRQDGTFYATGLSEGRYKLLIKGKDGFIGKEFTVTLGKIISLSKIKLR